jgi:hypothetical protein
VKGFSVYFRRESQQPRTMDVERASGSPIEDCGVEVNNFSPRKSRWTINNKQHQQPKQTSSSTKYDVH